MAYTDTHRTPREIRVREALLALMREKFRREPPRSRRRVLVEALKLKEHKALRPQSWKPKELAHAIRITSKMAAQEKNVNPLFVEALEIAASYFDDL